MSESENQRTYYLDTLRAIAIFLVLLAHFCYKLFPGGSIGVSVFFCLSGYLTSLNLLSKKVTTKEFILRRIFRIYPCYIAICSLHLLLLFLTHSTYSQNYKANIFNLLFMIKIPKTYLGLGSAIFWTLQIEMLFYLIVPLIIQIENSRRRI